MSADYDDGWGARRLDGSVPRRVNHDDGWGVPPHQRAEQMRRVWPQHTGVKMRRVWGRLVTTAQQDDGWGATTAQQAEWAFQAESRRMMLEGRGIWKPKHCRSLLELCAGQVFIGKTSLVVCVYSLDSIVPSEPYHYVQVPPEYIL